LTRLPQLWLIALAYGIYGAGPWFYFGWFPTWLVKSAGFTTTEMGVYASLPFFVGVGANLIGGQVADMLASRFGRRRAYAGMACACLIITGLLMVALSFAHDKVLIIALASLGFGTMDLMLPCAWSMCMAIGGSVGGTATAVMNTAGNFGGFCCTLGFGYILAATGSYEAPLRAVAVMTMLSGLVFATIDCTKGANSRLSVATS
jgi:nitrate/nitrite transporter NarK